MESENVKAEWSISSCDQSEDPAFLIVFVVHDLDLLTSIRMYHGNGDGIDSPEYQASYARTLGGPSKLPYLPRISCG